MPRRNRGSEFSAKTRLAAWNRSGGQCEKCTRSIKPSRPEYHHIRLAELDGDNSLENCLVVCSSCHQDLDNEGMKAVHKSNRIRKKVLNLKSRRSKMAKRPSFRAKKTLYSEIKFKASGNPSPAPTSQVAGGSPGCGESEKAPRVSHFPSRGAYFFRSIKTERLLIRKMNRYDVLHDIVNALNNDEHMRFSENRHTEHTISTQMKYITDLEMAGHLALGLFARTEHGCLNVSLGTMTCYVDAPNKLVDMGIMILPGFINKAYGLEAWKAVLDWWLDPKGGNFEKVEAGHQKGHEAMALICYKSGMRPEGKRPGHFLNGNKRLAAILWGKNRS